MSETWLLLAGLALAATIGWSVNEGGLCAVAATRELVAGGPPRLLAGSLLAAATAGLLILPAAWLFGSDVHLAGAAAIDRRLVLGAVLLAVGAIVNDACVLGSLARLGDGELRFLAMPLGIAAGFASVDTLTVTAPSRLMQPGLAGIVLLTVFLGLWLATFSRLRRDDVHLAQRRWPLAVAMLVLGIAGGALYAFAPGWSWSDAIRQHLPFAMAMNDGGAGTALAVATVGGSIAAALSERRFRARRPGWGPLTRSLLGGWIMAIGATMVPGGNDSLLLAAVPAGSASGIAAYLIMVVTVAGLLAMPIVIGRK